MTERFGWVARMTCSLGPFSIMWHKHIVNFPYGDDSQRRSKWTASSPKETMAGLCGVLLSYPKNMSSRIGRTMMIEKKLWRSSPYYNVVSLQPPSFVTFPLCNTVANVTDLPQLSPKPCGSEADRRNVSIYRPLIISNHNISHDDWCFLK